jgi:hypothetical protein
MLSVAQSIADAGVADEVCPLCLDRYAQVDECTCVVCHAPSCPGCAELLDTSGRMRCYACAPVARHVRARDVEATVANIRPARVEDAVHSLVALYKVGSTRVTSWLARRTRPSSHAADRGDRASSLDLASQT